MGCAHSGLRANGPPLGQRPIILSWDPGANALNYEWEYNGSYGVESHISIVEYMCKFLSVITTHFGIT